MKVEIESISNHHLHHPLRRRTLPQLHIHIGGYAIDLGSRKD
jgi:hypothetical protein